ncbi:MAG TPA: FAD-dependent oxidoreductase [Solirubrobacterales bacterium]
MNEKSSSAIVVGGGPAGLVAATLLAQAGVEITLLEAGRSFGGRAASVRRKGFDLNQGPHALYEGGPAAHRLAEMGIDLPRWNPASVHRSFFVRDGRARRLPSGPAGLTRWLVGTMRTTPAELAGLSTREWLQRSVRSEGARAGAASLVRVATFVADHDALPAEVAAGQVKLAIVPGVRYLRGGWQSLVDALAAKAQGAGAVLSTRSPVRGLRQEGGGWSVELDGGSLRADAVVLATGGPAEAAALLGEEAPQAPGPPAELSVLDLGLERLPRRGRTFATGIDEPAYLSRHSPPDHRDGVLLSLAGYTAQPRQALEAIADAVQPGWRERLTMERFLPRMTPITAVPTPAAGLAGRPAVDRGDGLYLAGDWIGPEGWLVDAAISSGAAAAAALVRRAVPAAA